MYKLSKIVSEIRIVPKTNIKELIKLIKFIESYCKIQYPQVFVSRFKNKKADEYFAIINKYNINYTVGNYETKYEVIKNKLENLPPNILNNLYQDLLSLKSSLESQ